MKHLRHYICIAIVLSALTMCMTLISCVNDNEQEQNNPSAVITSQPQPLNITILLDLSDRIKKIGGPNDGMTQREKDSTVISCIQKLFSDRQIDNGHIQLTGDKIKVLCYPTPLNNDIAMLLNSLTVDMGNPSCQYKNKMEKLKCIQKTLIDMPENWKTSVSNIYSSAMKTGDSTKWPGSDIYSFLDSKAQSLCVENDHRNILIVLTDGYILHEKSFKKAGTVCTGISASSINTQTSIGPVEANYNNKLEVLFLELNPNDGKNDDFKKMKQLITDWLNKMNVEKVEVVETDSPTNTEIYIKNFLK